jgi:hypothetical protein
VCCCRFPLEFAKGKLVTIAQVGDYGTGCFRGGGGGVFEGVVAPYEHIDGVRAVVESI